MRVGASEPGKKVARVEAASRTPNYALSLPARFFGHKMEKRAGHSILPSCPPMTHFRRASVENMRTTTAFCKVLTTQNTAVKAN